MVVPPIVFPILRCISLQQQREDCPLPLSTHPSMNVLSDHLSFLNCRIESVELKVQSDNLVDAPTTTIYELNNRFKGEFRYGLVDFNREERIQKTTSIECSMKLIRVPSYFNEVPKKLRLSEVQRAWSRGLSEVQRASRRGLSEFSDHRGGLSEVQQDF